MNKIIMLLLLLLLCSSAYASDKTIRNSLEQVSGYLKSENNFYNQSKNTWFERMDNFVESNPHWLWFKGILLVIVAALMIFSSLYRGKEEE